MALSIKIKSKFCFSYSEHLNKVPFIDEITIKNTGTADVEATKLVLCSEPCFFEAYEAEIPALAPGAVFVIANLVLHYQADVLASYDEALEGKISYQLLRDEKVLYKNEAKVDLRPYDEGSNYLNDAPMRAAFVTPNHPEILSLVKKISDKKGEKKGSYSVVAYQWGAQEVLATAECMFEVVKELEIAYVISKSGYHRGYQRIRLVDEILARKQGNCMDLTYLFASLLESLGLNPLIVITQTHAFVGFWLTDKMHAQPVIQEKDFLRKHTDPANPEIAIFECTHVTKGKENSFQSACDYAMESIRKDKDLELHIVDVARARKGGIVPLPARVSGAELRMVHDSKTGAVSKVLFEYPGLDDGEEGGNSFDGVSAGNGNGFGASDDGLDDSSCAVPAEMTKIQRWKNKLLDLSASSALLNLKITSTGKGAAYILSAATAELYKKVKSGQRFSLESQPEDFEKTKRSADLFELAAGVYSCKNIVESNLQQGILHLSYEESTSKKLLAALRSADRNHREQNGAGILYMTFGSLRWTEKKTGKQFYAPILLVPVVLEKIGKQFQLAYEGTEIFLNAAILEMLKIRFDLRPVGLNPLPMGADHKPDFVGILNQLRKACQNQSGLEVFEHVCIGVFAFSQYLMWNDLDKYEEFFLKHPVIKSIVDGEPMQRKDESEELPAEEDILLPMPADGSQIQAVRTALGNQSFVLHGPPGTGKSQTITLMLANYLGYDQTVLFSAEKAAALQVVYNRMKAIGLEDFCLYLPADAAKKSDVERFLAQYARLMEAAGDDSTNYEELKQEIAKVKALIEQQLAVFEIEGANGFSLEKLLCAALKSDSFGDAGQNAAVTKPAGQVGQVNAEKQGAETANGESVLSLEMPELLKRIEEGAYTDFVRLLKDAMYMGELAGGVKGHPLSTWKSLRYELGMQQMIREKSVEYLALLQQIWEIKNQLPAAVDADVQRKCYGAEDLRARFRAISYANIVPEELRAEKDVLRKLKDWAKYAEASKYRDRFYALIQPEFLDLDIDTLKLRWDMLRNKMSTWERIKRMDMKEEMRKYIVKKDFTDRDLTDIFEMAVKVRELNETVPFDLDYSLKMTGQQAKELADKIEMYYPAGVPELIVSCHEEERKLAQQGIALLQKHDGLCRKLKISLGSDAPLWNTKDSLDEAMQNVARWGDAMNTLREWNDYQMFREDCEAQGVLPWLLLYEDGMDCEKVLQNFESWCSRAMLRKVYAEHEEIRKFAGYRFENLVLRYEELMKQYYAVCAKEIRCRVLHRIADVLVDKNYAADRIALRKLIESAGKGQSIRSIMNRLSSFLLKMTPCVMATPMTTAMYFALDNAAFEHMVLDEASQLQTCKSVGLIARSRSAIVVGDPNQMPPTAFFESTALNADIDVLEEDQESILKDFIALDMPDYYLKWHYRSNHESLIAYSNEHYYGGRMITFPSRDNKNSRVRVVRTNGIYDRGHSTTNRAEAERLVEYLAEKFAEGDIRSYGIIAFNKRQQMLIERLIEIRCEADEGFEKAIAAMEERGEALFVRNLESVQGDERDVILFSVGFGPDEEGKIVMSFGPLAKAGGWRRLNVAITRARDEMILFTSMDAAQMTMTATTSRGVRDLKNFIAYAEQGNGEARAEHADEMAVDTKADGFADAICAYVEELGYKYARNVGSSALKMDIAVEDPEQSGEYMLGILLNSKAIDGAFSIYDSELGQPSILKGHGWKLLRLWSLDWLEDVQREKVKIRTALGVMM